MRLKMTAKAAAVNGKYQIPISLGLLTRHVKSRLIMDILLNYGI